MTQLDATRVLSNAKKEFERSQPEQLKSIEKSYVLGVARRVLAAKMPELFESIVGAPSEGDDPLEPVLKWVLSENLISEQQFQLIVQLVDSAIESCK